MGEMQNKSDLELVEAMRALITPTSPAPDRAHRILDEMERRAKVKAA